MDILHPDQLMHTSAAIRLTQHPYGGTMLQNAFLTVKCDTPAAANINPSAGGQV